MLSHRPGPVVTNLSTSARVEAVAARHRQTVVRTPVGEANVVEGILAAGARIGGEGNGGVIVPALHLGRDAPAGAALILSGLVERGISLSRWAGQLPALVMVKRKVEIQVAGAVPDWAGAARRLAALLPGAVPDLRDGLRMAAGPEWVHLRASGTEPILRVIAEAETAPRAAALADAAQAVLS
jgi:phosphomannomutase